MSAGRVFPTVDLTYRIFPVPPAQRLFPLPPTLTVVTATGVAIFEIVLSYQIGGVN
jgi:hypothetical protein